MFRDNCGNARRQLPVMIGSMDETTPEPPLRSRASHVRRNPGLNTGEGGCVQTAHKFWHRRGYLPHFDAGAVVQSITFRLADSLPRHLYVMAEASSKSDIVRQRRLDSLIDNGYGACLLRDPTCATLVESALGHFDGERYRLLAWVIMPNHVHAMIEQMEGYRLGDVIRSWKWFTSQRINASRQSSGRIWAKDYFDRYIRDERHFANALSYIEDNPVKAGLASRPEDWTYSSAKARMSRP
jgi:REP element-mobilizing transposase RayT